MQLAASDGGSLQLMVLGFVVHGASCIETDLLACLCRASAACNCCTEGGGGGAQAGQVRPKRLLLAMRDKALS